MNDVNLKPSWQLDAEAAAALALGAHPDPFAVLGPHDTPDGRVVRAFLPGAVNVDVLRRADRDVIASLQPGSEPGLFENLVPT
jgi:1,4-alpha-glucan branching enzyme